MADESNVSWHESSSLTRRQVLAGGIALGASGLLAACGGGSGSGAVGAATGTSTAAAGKLRRGGSLIVGLTGGSAKDSLDAHTPTTTVDNARMWQLYEPLTRRSVDLSTLEMHVAESVEADKGRADRWVVRIREGIEFHDGRPVTPEDVIFSLRRITDPKDPKNGSGLSYIDRDGLKKLDARTVLIPLQIENSTLPDDLGQDFNGIVPVDYDPAKPIGTGPFSFKSWTPGDQSLFTRNANYWQDPAFVDELTIIDFADETARVNALLSGQVHAISDLPPAQIGQVQGNSALKVLNTETGLWSPLAMRTHIAPFDDPRVRQAFRLIMDRQQMLEQALSGNGRIANDLYSPYDPAYASDLPQREQDLDQAKSLLKQAGRSDLSIELLTSPFALGVVELAQVFAQQAKGAGVTVNVKKSDDATVFGPNRMKFPIGPNYWASHPYLVQVATTGLPDSPVNETQWDDAEFGKLIHEARKTLDEGKRNEILKRAQKREYDLGGYLIPYFINQVDAHSTKIGGLAGSRSGYPLHDFGFRTVGFVS